jgi:hypothetical protein
MSVADFFFESGTLFLRLVIDQQQKGS